jgi:ABC-type uncharacterized transport system substrate-binding protein
MSSRREFITLLGGAVTWPLAGHAQQGVNIPRIGFLGLAGEFGGAEALRAGLRDLGHAEGANIVIEWRWAEKVDQLPELAAGLVRMKVNVIFAPSSTFVEAARQVTTTIPIVFAVHADPVGIGHVASLPRPGGNITGLTMLLTDLAAKELEILKEAVPQATRIGVLWNPTTPSHPPALSAVEAGAEKLQVQLLMVPAAAIEDFAGAFSTMTRERVDAFLVIASPITVAQRTLLAELAVKHRLPGMFGVKDNVKAGGLMSYAADLNDLYRRAAVYIDKILRVCPKTSGGITKFSEHEAD